jgi:poly(3-hydroxybutyrate) depolymerase
VSDANLASMLLYPTYQAHSDLLWPLQVAVNAALGVHERAPAPRWRLAGEARRRLAAAYEVFASLRLTHTRPAFGIDTVSVDGREVAVSEEVAWASPFGTLLRFRKDIAAAQPRVLIVAPMSGHFATLLRETVRTMLADHDVFITDWRNARDVSILHGRFGLDEYIAHLIACLQAIGPGAHMVAVCQPCVATLAAAALMAEDEHPAQPRSLTLMAGPIDCRIAPTRVNELATRRPIHWFEANLIATVPLRFAGALRRVYPGFLQLTAFMSMNLERHVRAFVELHNHLLEGELDKAEATQAFYEEYFAVADLPADFYLETVRKVFQEYELPRGVLAWRGRRIDCGAIRRTALLTVEGEKDDICAPGQTLAAHDLCRGIRPYLKQHHVQTGVGHYGVFSGRRWNQEIYPLVRDMIHIMN